jgi:hypothetical protein
MHSPNWVDDPTLDTVNYWSDWEYYSDDYFDEVEIPGATNQAKIKEGNRTRTRKRKAEDGERPGKRQRLNSSDRVAPLSRDADLSSHELEILQRPSIVWRSTSAPLSPLPKTKGLIQSVAFLKNWADLPSPAWGLSFKDEQDKDTESVKSHPDRTKQSDKIDHPVSLRQDYRGSTKDTQDIDQDSRVTSSTSQTAGRERGSTRTSASKGKASKGTITTKTTTSKRKKQSLVESKDDVENKESSKKRKVTNMEQEDRPIATATKKTRSGKPRG